MRSRAGPALPGVSRETRARLDIYADALTRWQGAVNLVATASLPDLWTRHIDDSLQLHDLAPSSKTWIDLGSGAGLPGLIVAAANPDRHVVLVESDARKCAFLRHAAAAMGLSVDIREARVETVRPDLAIDVVTARGLAPLPRLLGYAQPFLQQGAVGLFPKGRRYADELTEARESWTFTLDFVESRTDRDGRILRVRDLSARILDHPTS